MKILFAGSECAPYVKTGGLGDVLGSLPQEIAKKGNEVSVVIPLYKQIKEKYFDKLEFVKSFFVPLSWRSLYCGVYKAEENKVTYYFIDNEYYFNRDSLYGHFDDGERYAYFSRSVLEMMIQLNYFPDIINANDWQSALIPIFLRYHYNHIDEYKNIKTVFTIHNIEYQGKCKLEFYEDILGLPTERMGDAVFDGMINFMKCGIVYADKVTTVSKTYSYELKYEYYAHGLHNIIRENEHKLDGIVNGIDIKTWNPWTDKFIYQRFSAKTFGKKKINKAKVQEELGLEVRDDVCVVSIISRLAAHKGIDLVRAVCESLLKSNIQLIILGTGEEKYEKYFRYLENRYRGRVCSYIDFKSDLSHRIYAATDLFLMPSKSEPCGLSQMIAMRYGAVPVVRETGGLVDTVEPINIETGEGEGFTFKTYDAGDMLEAIWRAVGMYFNDREKFNEIAVRDMKKDFSWKNSAEKYIELYNGILN